MDYLKGLNDKQKEAVKLINGPLLVVAGAGSGKTRVLTHRIAHMIENEGISSRNILALTFTNKAAKEMKERIEKLLEDSYVDDIWMGTFHSICVRILRRYIERLGYDSSFVIFDTVDQKTLVKECIKERDLNEKLYEPKNVIAFISSQKNIMVSPEEYKKTYQMNFRDREMGELYALYQKKLKQNNAMDFDDLIGKTIELFVNNEDVLEYYQEKFKYILVDEYQDTNGAQYELIRLLAMKYKNICVVGDSDQSIYGWRGADITNILNFEKDYDNAKVVKLEQNYRSTNNILLAANEVIKNNIGRKVKKLWTENEEGEKIHIFAAQDEQDEAKFIADRIMEGSIQNQSYSDFAILYRTNAQSRVIEERFMRENIPYKIVGGLKFYDRKEIKDIIAYLRLIQNPVDNISLKRIINVPKRGIGAKSIEKLEEYANEKGESLYSAILDAEFIPGLSQRAMSKIKDFGSMVAVFMAMKEVMGVGQLMDKVVETIKYIDQLNQENTIESLSRIENIKEFRSAIVDYEQQTDEATLEDFLAGVSLLSDVDKTEEDDGNSVTLMTLHSSKGLEFPTVFLCGVEEGIFPTSRAMTDDGDLEEERRLCYVGITRAEEKLFISHANRRMLYGRTNYATPSRFIREIPEELIYNINGGYGKPKNEFKQASSKKYFTGYKKVDEVKQNINPSGSKKAGVGSKVKHKLWGMGTIVQVVGSADDQTLVVAFDSQGIKKLKLNQAPIEIV